MTLIFADVVAEKQIGCGPDGGAFEQATDGSEIVSLLWAQRGSAAFRDVVE